MAPAGTQQQDQELLTRLCSGDDSALFEIHRRYAPLVYRCAQRVLSDRRAAEECTQDTFLTMWSKRTKVKIYGESVVPWLLTTARFVALNRRRQLQRTQRNEAELNEAAGVIADPLSNLVEMESISGVREAVASLSETDRAIVSLCIAQDLTYKEAAALLGLTHSAVRNRLSRARTQLRRTFDRNEVGPK